MTCPSCGFESPDGFKFCGQCGTPFAEAEPKPVEKNEPTDQRRTVTILFADVSGFTALSERLDPETVRDIMDGCFSVLTEQIQAFGGTIDKFIGDAVMALFGAPVAYGDDPERAVRAALGMQNALKAFASNLRAARGVELGIRIGVNTGRVVWGRVGGDAGGAFTVMGDAVNLASRLEEAAPVGGVLVGESTWRHVKTGFEAETLEPIQVKGKADPVQVYRVIREAHRSLARKTAGPRTPFVNREQELGLLRGSLARVGSDRQAASVTLLGSPGSGKSRLIAEFRRECGEREQAILVARPAAFGQGSVWAPWRDLLVRAAGLRRGLSLDEQRDQLAGWLNDLGTTESRSVLELLAGVDDPADPDLQPLRESPKRLVEALQKQVPAFFTKLVEARPAILVAEDLQWWSSQALDLLNGVAQLEGRILVVASARPDFSSESWPPAHGVQETVELKPLSSEQILKLVEGVLGEQDAVTPWLALRVTDLSGGNPFFAEEIVQALVEQGVLELTLTGWKVDEDALGSEGLPSSIEGLIQARIDRLDPIETRILQKASASGRVFWDRLLTDGMNEPGAGAVLDRLAARDFVYLRKRSRFPEAREFAFRQALIREVTYENSLLKHRRENHEAIARWMEEQVAEDRSALAEDLAAHYLRAERADLAVPHLVAAGEKALEAGALEAAVEHLTQAIGNLASSNDELRLRAYFARGRTYRFLGRIDQAVTDLEASAALARSLGESELQARAHIELAGSHYQRAEFREVEMHGIRAKQIAVEASLPRRQATALNLLAIAARGGGKMEEALAYYQEALRLDEAGGNRAGAGSRLSNIGTLNLAMDNYSEAIRCFRAALDEPIPRHSRAIATSNLGLATLLDGRPGECEAIFEEARDHARAAGLRWVEAEAIFRLGAARALTGRAEAGLSSMQDGLARLRSIEAYEPYADSLWLRARVHSHLGDRESAKADLEECLELANSKGLDVSRRRAEAELERMAAEKA